jgi:hypothetical protein
VPESLNPADRARRIANRRPTKRDGAWGEPFVEPLTMYQDDDRPLNLDEIPF